MRKWVFVFITGMLSACANKKDAASITISFPKKSSISSKSHFTKSEGSLTSMWNGQINLESEVDCFGIFVGGPESIHQRNFCNEYLTDKRVVDFGNYYGAVGRNGQEIQIEIDADVSREITLIAMGSQSGTCVDFAGLSPPKGEFTHPRIIHQKTYQFSAGPQAIYVDLKSVFDNTNPQLDRCQFDSPLEPSIQTPLTPALLSFSTTTPHDFGSVSVGGSQSVTLSLMNSGQTTASSLTAVALAAPFAYTGGSFPGTSGTCGFSLAAGSSCLLNLEFIPSIGGAFSETLSLTYDDGFNLLTLSKNLQGTGLSSAILSISDGPGAYDFGISPAGSSQQKTFTINNVGSATATAINGVGLATPFSFFGGSFPGAGGTCASTLLAGGSCTVVVSYSPVVPSGGDMDSLLIDYHDGISTIQALRDLSGVAVAPANLVISETDTYDFGTIAMGATSPHIFTITNTGGFPASSLVEVGLNVPFEFSGGGFPGTNGDCAVTLSSGASCNLEIQFNPIGIGLVADTIDLAYNDGVVATNVTRAIQGTGAAPAVLTIGGPYPYDFGLITASSSQTTTLTVTNSGGVAATGITDGAGLATPFSYSAGVFPGTLGTCSPTLLPGASCTLDLTFFPIAISVYTDSLILNYYDGAMPAVLNHGVTGTGN